MITEYCLSGRILKSCLNISFKETSLIYFNITSVFAGNHDSFHEFEYKGTGQQYCLFSIDLKIYFLSEKYPTLKFQNYVALFACIILLLLI